MDCCVLFVVAWNENEMSFACSIVALSYRNIHHLILQSKESVVVVVVVVVVFVLVNDSSKVHDGRNRKVIKSELFVAKRRGDLSRISFFFSPRYEFHARRNFPFDFSVESKQSSPFPF